MNFTDQEAYDYIVKNLPSYQQRYSIRYSREFKDFTITWCKGNFNAKNKVGSLMASIAKLPSTATRTDWANHFFANNLSPAGILKEVERLTTHGNLDFNTALTYWWIHLQDSVYTGWKDEVDCEPILRDWAHRRAYEIRHATDWEDRNYCVDYIIFDPNTNEVKGGVQVKGIAALKSKRENAVRARLILDPPKYQAFFEKYGVEVWYMLIEDSLKAKKVAWHTTKCYN